jgi:hypothetical protein
MLAMGNHAIRAVVRGSIPHRTKIMTISQLRHKLQAYINRFKRVTGIYVARGYYSKTPRTLSYWADVAHEYGCAESAKHHVMGLNFAAGSTAIS